MNPRKNKTLVKNPILTLVAAGLLWASTPFTEVARACDCLTLGPPTPDVRNEAPYIFEGRVLETVERTEHTTTTRSGRATSEVRPLDRLVVFEVKRAWRGVTKDRVVLAWPMSDCMFPFGVGREYLVFAHADSTGRPETTICARTRPLGAAANVIRHLGEPTFVAKPRKQGG
jgi:hypothetical protein